MLLGIIVDFHRLELSGYCHKRLGLPTDYLGLPVLDCCDTDLAEATVYGLSFDPTMLWDVPIRS
jgi:hypothetical protein